MVTAINVDTNIYNVAQHYAAEHSTSVRKLLEDFIISLQPIATDRTRKAVRVYDMTEEELNQDIQGAAIPLPEDCGADEAGIVNANSGRLAEGMEKWL